MPWKCRWEWRYKFTHCEPHWVVSSTFRPFFPGQRSPVPIGYQAERPQSWSGRKFLESIPGRPARSQSLYRLSYKTEGNYKFHATALYKKVTTGEEGGEAQYLYTCNYALTYEKCMLREAEFHGTLWSRWEKSKVNSYAADTTKSVIIFYRAYETTRERITWFELNLILGSSAKICRTT
jgi:hypothetical protein